MNPMDEPEQRLDAQAGIRPPRPAAVVTDQRLVRGARARRRIARHAVDVASVEGLGGLSIGRLAADLGLSKSGIQTLFKTKENLQLATISSAREQFTQAVIRPAQALPRGSARLRALVEHWITYAETPLFAGGCFWAANLADFDSRPGPVRDALFVQHQDWVTLLAGELRHAADVGEIAGLDANLAAFQIDAVLIAANTALRLGDHQAVTRVRRVIDGILGARP
jgi:AcrR family transcriptional regulator